MHEVLRHGEAPVATEVAADRAGGGARRVGRAGERAEALDHAVPGDADGDDRARLHELDERLVERLALVLLVVLLEQGALGLHHAEVDDLVALGLDAAEDLAGEAAGDASGLTRTRVSWTGADMGASYGVGAGGSVVGRWSVGRSSPGAGASPAAACSSSMACSHAPRAAAFSRSIRAPWTMA